MGYPFHYLPKPRTGTGGGGGSSSKPSEPKEGELSPASGVLPVKYGYGRIPVAGFVYLNTLNRKVQWIFPICEGAIGLIGDVYINDKLSSEYQSRTIYIEKFTGTAYQSVCSTLQALDPTWTYAMTNVAYLYVEISPMAEITGMPTVEVVVQGKKLYDNRTGLTVYSTNPVLAIVDMLTNIRYGGRMAMHTTFNDVWGSGQDFTFGTEADFELGGSPSAGYFNWPTINGSADYCENVLENNAKTIQEPRYSFNYYFGSEITLQDALDIARLHCLAVNLYDEGQWKIELARPRTLEASFIETEMLEIDFLKKTSADDYNVINVEYIDPNTNEPEIYTLEDPNLGVNDEIHEGTFDLKGFRKLSHAKRIGIFLLNARLSDLQVKFRVTNSKGLEVLDPFTITHALGVTAKQFYTTGIAYLINEQYIIEGFEDQPELYSEVVETEPTFPDTTLAKPTDTPDDVTNLILTEDLKKAKDHTWFDSIVVTFEHSAFTFKKKYVIYARENSDDNADWYVVGEVICSGTNRPEDDLVRFSFNPVIELTDYDIKVVTVSVWNINSAGVSASIIPQGRYLPPEWKAGASLSAVETGDIVHLRWLMADLSAPAEDIDPIKFYQLLRGRTTDNWESASEVITVDALSFQDKLCPAGTWRYFLKAIDSVGTFSAIALTADVTVTLNPNLGFQEDHDLDLNGSVVTQAVIARAMTNTDWAYPSQGLSWQQRWDMAKAWNDPTQTYPMSTYPAWSVPVPTTGTMRIVTPQVDLDSVMSGTWSFYYTAVKIGTGTASETPKLQLSENGVDWTEYNASSLFSAKARYIKGQIDFTCADDKTHYVIKERMYIHLKADPIEEEHDISVLGAGSQPLHLDFDNTYNFIKQITVTLLGSTSRHECIDNLTLIDCDIYVHDNTGSEIASDGKIYIKGY